MITIEQYLMGRDTAYPQEWKDEYRDNALVLIENVNGLLAELGILGERVTSGYRPPSINNKTHGAARKSHHQTGHAVDIADPTRSLARLLTRNIELLRRRGLYLENPAATRGWVHLQNIPPTSKRIIFDP